MKIEISKLIVFLLIFSSSFSQEEKELKISFSGFLETFYTYDFNEPVTEKKLSFMYNFNRHNEFNVNMGMFRTKAEYKNTYCSIAIHSGTYVEDNYAKETIKVLNEAFVGVFLDSERKSTIEMGILPSYIGFETANNGSNLTLTRSLLAENSPYFMTGIKYNYQLSPKWNFSGLLTNGWQRIRKPNKNATPSFGTQVVYKPSEKATLNWSTYFGEEPVGTEFKYRYFSNLYYDFQWKSKWRTIVGFDLGFQENAEYNGYNNWFTPVLITQYSINSKWQTAFRAEYYQDINNVIISSDGAFKTWGTSLNVDFLPNSKVKLRTEARYFNSKEAIFVKSGSPVTNDLFVTTSLSFEF